MRDKIVDVMPEMKTGKELLDCLRETPEYPACIWEKSSMERLVALSDIYNVYIPSRMSVEIYHKLYMGLLRSMQKKESMQAVYQKYENQRGIRGGRCRGILGGSDSFTILGASGIGKSSAVFRAIDLIMTKKVIETEEPYCRIAPCIIVQCPFDSSVKGLLLEILRKVDEVLGSKYYVNALKARASVDMLINNSGIAICMVGTPESIPFFEQAMQLARRSLGLQYEAMQFGDEFCEVCRELFLYQYTKTRMELSAGVTEWLFEHCGGNISVLVSLIHDAQEIAILEGDDVLDMAMLEAAYQKRMSMLHDYLEPSIKRKKQSSDSRKRASVSVEEPEGTGTNIQETLAGMVSRAKKENLDVVEVFKQHFKVEEVAV